MTAERKCGFVAVLGLPNAGKSTLVNRLVGAKVSIVTPKPQTTRFRIAGVAIRGETQLVFLDLPGIFAAKRRLERAMVAAAWKGASEADIVLVMIDTARGVERDVETVLSELAAAQRRVVVALNKIDLIPRPKLLPLADKLRAYANVERVFMISATSGEGTDDLADFLASAAPAGPWLYPEDQLTDLSERLLAAELVREQLFLQLHEELPYAVAVETESWEERPDGSVRVGCVVFVEREGQRGIVIGAKGSRVKTVGEAARAELEALLGRRVHLFLHIKARPEWREDSALFRAMGLEFSPKSERGNR